MNFQILGKFRLFAILLFIVIICSLIYFFHTPVKIRHILLISIDTCRADYLSCYGYHRKSTPNTDQIAKEGILFANAITPAPITLPAHSSMLTGTIPPYHGVHNNNYYQLGQSNVTLAEILKKHGFKTAAIVSAFMVDSQFGLDQGFDYYNDSFDENLKSIGIGERRAEETTHYALKWLEKNYRKTYFLFLHYFDPHIEYDPPELFRPKDSENELSALYAGEISYVDHCIGQVIKKLKGLGIYDSTLIIITSDHGEMLGEHGEDTHGYFIYQSSIKVPLIFKLPEKTKSKNVKELVSLIDIVPTVCGLLGIKPPPQVQGIDLSPYFTEENIAKTQRHLYCESLYPTIHNANSLLGIVTDHWKYIQTTRPELYDLTKDPQESNNLVEIQPQQASILQDKLKVILEKQVRKDSSDSKLDLDNESIKRLQSLGYIAGTPIDENLGFDQTKDDPKDLIDFHNLCTAIPNFVNQEKYSEAKNLCEQLLAQKPDAIMPLLSMGVISVKQGNFSEAVPVLYKVIELHPDNTYALNYLGIALGLQNKLDEAANQFRKALQVRPDFVEAHYNLAGILREQKAFEEAIDHYRKALKINPNNAKAHYHLALTLVMAGQINGTLEHFREAVRLEPDDWKSLNGLARILAVHPDPKLRNPKQAITLAQRAVELTMQQEIIPLNTLATAYASAGQLDKAIAAAQEALELASKTQDEDTVVQIRRQIETYRQAK
ncbi:MAG: sulfatase-like hydrolase/transferase [Planctomycetota bacterium]|jgi:arylsulfatase A-like enzyme/Flp pilus assembly protein TadD